MTLNNPLVKAIWEQSRIWVLVILIILLLSVALLIYQGQFVSPSTERLQQRQAALQKQLSDRQAELVESGVPVSDVEQMESDLQKFAELIPSKQKFANFIGELFHWADQSRLDIREISYQPQIDKETEFLHYGLNFSVEGTYDQLKNFIHLLENSKRILIIEKIGLSGKRDKNNAAQVSLNINLTALFQEDAP
jgi:Tfp pilus assembly protein PilO